MNREVYRFVALGLILYSILAACADNRKTTNESESDKSNAVVAINSTISKFLPYYSDLTLDTNTLIFYCARTFDTSSLIHFQKGNGGIKVLYYEMLPTYHQNVNDFAIDKKGELLFFEGYSFIIDSTTWQEIKLQATSILQTPDTFRRDIYKDGSEYGLYYGLQHRRGDSNHENLFEKFAASLKNLFLREIIQARKPELHYESSSVDK